MPQPISKSSADARLRARTVAANVVLATLWSFFVIRHVLFFLETGEPTALGVIALESLVATLFVLRREARAISLSPMALAATALGTFAPLALVPTDADIGAQHIALLIQLVGLVAAVVSLASLRRSFGLVPSNRGIRTTGMYRLVRHPLYASYGLVWIAYLLANPSLWNGAVIAFATIGQAARIGLEERLLMRDEAYALYAGATRYRLVPGIY